MLKARGYNADQIDKIGEFYQRFTKEYIITYIQAADLWKVYGLANVDIAVRGYGGLRTIAYGTGGRPPTVQEIVDLLLKPNVEPDAERLADLVEGKKPKDPAKGDGRHYGKYQRDLNSTNTF